MNERMRNLRHFEYHCRGKIICLFVLLWFFSSSSSSSSSFILFRGRRGRDRMVVGLTTTCTISVYHH
jgi:hypothetical protein